jgi:hypothetical protein
VRERVGPPKIQADARPRRRNPLENGSRGSARRLLKTQSMETLIDPFELSAPGECPTPAPRMRPMLASIVIDVEWDEPPPSTSQLRGVRVWATED